MRNFLVVALSICFFTLFSFGQVELRKSLEQHVTFLAAEEQEGRGLGTAGTLRAQEYIIKAFESAGLSKFGDAYTHVFDARISLAWVKGTNIMGYVEGNDPQLKNEYILVGAHYDHLGFVRKNEEKVIYPGADDNASGTAGVIELARYFAKPENRPKRSIIFVCFDAEESGLIGSTEIARNPPVPIAQIKAMFSLDMIGMLEAYGGLDLKGISMLAEGKTIFQNAANEVGVRIKNTAASIEQQTDTAPYGAEGIPSIHVFTGLKSPYHKPEDKSHLLDYEGMEKVVRILQKSLTDLANLPEIALAKGINAQKIMEGGKKQFFYASAMLLNGAGHFRFVDENVVAKRRYNAALGLQFQFRLNQNFRIVNEVMADYNGSATFEGNVRRVSATIPLMLQLATSDVMSEDYRAFLNIGGYYRHNFLALQDGNELPLENGFEEGEYGISITFGVQISKFQAFYTYRRALSENNIAQNRFQDVNNMIGISYRLW